jgi:hypothetical protein
MKKTTTPARSNRPEVRNPVLGLESVRALQELEDHPRAALATLLSELSAEARDKAETCWRKNKGPMAAYWKAVSIYAKHTARATKNKA